MKTLTTLSFLVLFHISWGQTILFVDDNNNITDNTDTVLVALQGTNYSTFDYYNVADSSANPSLALLSNYDLVIWYASTDGVGLGFWANGTTGDTDLKNYLIAGGRAWIIGSDLLYAGGYSTPTSFTSGEFASDFMGLASYNVQSYGDDGGLGAPLVNTTGTAPTAFPQVLDWVFSTVWWIDGVTMVPGASDMYMMGPNSYVLGGQISMAHFKDIETNVMSTFFDPALIATTNLRMDFIEETIFYLLNFNLGFEKMDENAFSLYPNPAADILNIISKSSTSSNYSIKNGLGQEVAHGLVSTNKVDVSNLTQGIYFITIDGTTNRFVKK